MQGMKKVKYALIVGGIVGFSMPLFSQNTNILTFDEAYQISLKNNHSLKQAQAVLDEKTQLEKAQKGLYMPKIGVSANYVAMSDNITMDLNPVKDAITPIYGALGNFGDFSGVPTGNPLMPYLNDEMSTAAIRKQLLDGQAQLEAANWEQVIQEKQFGTVDVTFQWVLFAGGKVRAANKVSQLQQDESEFYVKQKEGELLCNLVQQYYGLCLAQEVTKVRKDVLDAMIQHVSDARKLVEQGQISDAELLHVQIYQAEAEREFSKAVYTENLIKSALANLLADKNYTTLSTVNSLFVLDSIQPLEYFIQLADEKNPMLAQIKLKYEQAYKGYSVERANYLPSLAAMGTYNVANVDLSPLVPDWMVGVGLSWTIFDGSARSHKVQSAKLKTVQVDEYYNDALANINLMIQKTYNELAINKDQLKSLVVSENFAKEYVRIQEKAFDEGIINSTDLLDARLNYAKQTIDELHAMYEYDVNLAILLHYTGIANQFLNYKQNK